MAGWRMAAAAAAVAAVVVEAAVAEEEALAPSVTAVASTAAPGLLAAPAPEPAPAAPEVEADAAAREEACSREREEGSHTADRRAALCSCSASETANAVEGPPPVADPELSEQWFRIPVKITTPFAEADGELEVPEHDWGTCRISPGMLSTVYCVSNVLGVYCSFASGRRSYCQLRLGSFRPYTGMQPTRVSHIWLRLQSIMSRVELRMPPGRPAIDQLVNSDDEVSMVSIGKDGIEGLRISISLMNPAERQVDDATVAFRETEERAAAGELCCICLEPMLAGEMCRRMACLHSLHAGCAMTFLPKQPNCPICRFSIVQLPPGAAAAAERRRQRAASRQRTSAPPVTGAQSRAPHGSAPSSPGNFGRRAASAAAASAGAAAARAPNLSLPKSVMNVLYQGLKTMNMRSWSGPRIGRVSPQEH
mmetsp:Transcript_49571/g.112895  ORF Transcript_49571/g.112895 Transcript_49571/m.112895 type:complete len:422 (+) Transcript_49571:259-1524(+)